MMDGKTETRPRITVDEASLRTLRAFSEEFDLDMDEVYGKAIESFATDLETEERVAIATDIKQE